MAFSPTDLLVSLQNGVVAINQMVQNLKTVTTTSSGVVTIRLTMVST